METVQVPDKLKVGYRHRDNDDLFNGYLGFAVYYRKNGKVAKETSFEGWRDDTIDPDDFDNEPTNGFVFNKGVGGVCRWSHHGGRQAMIRVFDPRGFEVEISIDNMLFIMSHYDVTCGKGIMGELVYAWNKDKLLLLPITSTEYKEAQEYTKLLAAKLTKADMVPGCWYRRKSDNGKMLYLGYHPSRKYTYKTDFNFTEAPGRKYHIFCDEKRYGPDYKQKYHESVTGYTTLSERVTFEKDERYGEELYAFKRSKLSFTGVKTRLVSIPVRSSKSHGWRRNLMIGETKEGKRYLAQINRSTGILINVTESTVEEIITKAITEENNYDRSWRNSGGYTYPVFVKAFTVKVIDNNGVEKIASGFCLPEDFQEVDD